ncbi:hypothetical protein D3C85_1817460 [compost metagenome]
MKLYLIANFFCDLTLEVTKLGIAYGLNLGFCRLQRLLNEFLGISHGQALLGNQLGQLGLGRTTQRQ